MWAGEQWGLALHEIIHIDYHWIRQINPSTRSEITRDGVPIVLGYHVRNEDSFTFDTAASTISASDCEPHVDGCGERTRLLYEVTCPDLPSPLHVLDGTETLIPCSPGHQMTVENLLQAIDTLTCTEMPERQSVFMIVRNAH